MRGVCGSNDNPTIQQLKGAMRKLLFYNEVTSSTFANCIDNLNILTVTKRNNNTDTNTEPDRENMPVEDEEYAEQCDENFENIEEMNAGRIFEPDTEIESKEDATIAFLAGKIEKKAESSRFKCLECENICKQIFSENENISGEFFDNPDTQKPCRSTFIIANHAYRAFNDSLKHPIFEYKRVHDQISHSIMYENLYSETDFSHDAQHKNFLIGFIVDEFIRTYGTYVAKCWTMEKQQEIIRTRNRKIVHFKGQ